MTVTGNPHPSDIQCNVDVFRSIQVYLHIQIMFRFKYIGSLTAPRVVSTTIIFIRTHLNLEKC